MDVFGKGRVLFAVASSYAVGFLGWLFIDANLAEWYAGLAKPFLAPPASFFFFAWIILYGLIGIGLGAVWAHTPLWHSWPGLFYVSLAFNAAWSLFFLGLHVMFIALIDAVILAFLLLMLMISAVETDKRSAYFLIPYLAWVTFALYLTAGVWLMN
ncbi:MAG TPA: TspO/MBR family protein [Candidatus Paceibacterota bacterium]|nr:TspO/MBR family protein [Candidatus Paceibacterota bacterium]